MWGPSVPRSADGGENRERSQREGRRKVAGGGRGTLAGCPVTRPASLLFSPPSPPPGGARLPLGTFAVVGLGLVPSPPAGPAGASVGARSHGGCLWSLDTALPPEVGPGWDTPAVPGQSGCGSGSAAGTRWGGRAPASAPPPRAPFEMRPQIRRGDPLNLSILVSGGKETNEDSLSNGE